MFHADMDKKKKKRRSQMTLRAEKSKAEPELRS